MDTRTLCESRWSWMRDTVLQSCPELTESDLEAVAGDHAALVSLLADRLGWGWSEAADRLDEMVAST